MSKALLYDATVCIGCKLCEKACAERNNLPYDDNVAAEQVISAHKLTAVMTKGDKFMRRLCMNCEDPTCASVCPVGALSKTAMGPVTYDESRCIGCRYCMLACPFGVPKYEWGKVLPRVRKCDMCADRVAAGRPTACAEICPTGATKFGDRDELIAEAKDRIAKARDQYVNHIYGLEEVGGTSLLLLAAVLVVLGFITNRLNVSITGMEGSAGLHYIPQWTEIAVTGSIVAAGFAIFGLAAKYLPIFPEGPLLPTAATTYKFRTGGPYSNLKRTFGISLFLICVLVLAPSAAFGEKSSKAKTQYRSGQKGFAKFVEYPGAERVGSDQCQGCHAGDFQTFRHSIHFQETLQCEDCHGAGSLHVKSGDGSGWIIKFKQQGVEVANGVCLSCHAQDEKVRHWLSGSHAANHLRCVDCHPAHLRALRSDNESRISFDTATRGALVAASVSPETNVILRPRSATNDACLKCHQTEGAQLSMPYHHPLREGKMSCEDCHDPHGGPAGNNLRTANVNQLCLSCHAQYRGPFAYQHPPVTENCMNCHTAHGSPNTNLLTLSQPALCLQCHAGHHNGAGLPLADRCTNCHGSIHGTDVPTPSGGSRFIDKGCSEVVLRTSGGCPAAGAGLAASHSTLSALQLLPVPSHVPTYGAGVGGGALGMLSSGSVGGSLGALSARNMAWGGNSDPPGTEAAPGNAYYSLTPGAYRFIDGSGFLGRVGEYDSLQESAGGDAVTAYVSPENHLSVVSRANVLSGFDYSASAQLTAGERLQAGFNMRGFVQQQDNYPFYAFPVLDVPITPPAATNCLPSADCTTQLIPSHTVFGVRRRLGDAYARFKVPKVPVHLFVKGDWQARVGRTQFAYLDENSFVTTPGFAQFCGAQCHFQSGGSLNAQFQQVNYTTRNIGGGADVDLGPVRLTYEHKFSSFNDRLIFPTGTFTGTFHPADDVFGYSGNSPATTPPSGPTPGPVEPGNYFLDIPAPNQYSSDGVRLSWTASPKLTFNGNVAYTRLRDTYTRYPQHSFDSDNTLNWRPLDRLRVTADYHQQNLINAFTPYYSLYGNVSYHDHWERLRLDYELPKDFDVEAYYKRNGITRSNASLWQLGPFGVGQIYSVDNTDLLSVVPSSFSDTGGLALRYHDRSQWSARAGYEWTGTHHPGYLIVPQSNNRTFANLWLTLTPKLVFTNDLSIIVQNAFPAVPLPNTPGAAPLSPPYSSPTFGINVSGLPPNFQRRARYYSETASANLQLVPRWNLGFGYSYQQNNLRTYMAFQNDSSPNYVLEEPNVPYKQITQAYWGESTYTFKQRAGLNLRLIYNSARSGFRPDLNPNDAARLGNAFLISQGTCESGTPPPCFDPVMFQNALGNLAFASTQISQVIVPQWIGQSKAYYHFPNGFEGGLVFYYGSYRDQLNPNLNGVLRTFSLYVGRSW